MSRASRPLCEVFMSDPKKLQVKVKAGDAARHGTDKAGAILPPLLAMGPVRRCYAILLLALCTAFGPCARICICRPFLI